MNTTRSKQKVTAFLTQEQKMKRTTQRVEKTLPFSPDEIFFQFCPSRELDWIEGWACDLVYTSTGYVEKDCIFTTSATNILGSGLWIVTRYELNQKLELVRVIEEAVVIHFRINLIDNNDGTSTGVWHLTFTALNESGNAIIESIPETSPDLVRAIDGLEYYLQTGEMMTTEKA